MIAASITTRTASDGGDRDPVHVRKPGQAESEDRDYDGGARNNHAASGRRDRLDDGVVAVLARGHSRAESG